MNSNEVILKCKGCRNLTSKKVIENNCSRVIPYCKRVRKDKIFLINLFENSVNCRYLFILQYDIFLKPVIPIVKEIIKKVKRGKNRK